MQQAEITTLDARGLNCPMPVLKTSKALRLLEKGTQLRVLSSDPGSVRDIASLVQQSGNQLLEQADDNGEFSFLIEKN